MRAFRFASIASFLLLALAGPAAARGGMPNPLTPRGEIIEGIYYQIFVVAVVVFIFVMALMAWVVIRYRANSGHGKATFEHERENLKLEMTWIIIPLFIMLWIGYISYAGLVQLDEGLQSEDAFMELDIVGQKWLWQAHYDEFVVDAEYDALGNIKEGFEFYIPADVPIKLNVTSTDVIHAFHISDANWASVGMVDANPTGPHKYNSMTIEFPQGEYHVQCREMCFNPGHAYMRAKIVAVPLSEYNVWYEEFLAEYTAPKLNFPIEITDGGVDAPIMKTAPNAAVRLQFANDGAADRTFMVGADTVAVPAGSLVTHDVLPAEVGTVAITSDGVDLSLEVVQPMTLDVELGDFYISPASFTLQAGELYRINLLNVGGSPHNLYLGSYTDASTSETQWASDTYNGGQQGSMLVLVQEPMSFDTWCNVAGHAASGMLATANAA